MTNNNWYGQDFKPVLTLVLDGEPLTKSNQTFFGRGHSYIPAKCRKYEDNLMKAAQAAVKKAKQQRLKGLLIMEIWYFVGSKRRKDLPNLPKSTTDALNKTIYDDDFQIHDMVIHRRIDRERPRVEIIIWTTTDQEWENA